MIFYRKQERRVARPRCYSIPPHSLNSRSWSKELSLLPVGRKHGGEELGIVAGFSI